MSWPRRLKALPVGRQRLFACLLGVLATTAMPPLFLWPLLWLVFPCLVWLLDAAISPYRAAAPSTWATQPRTLWRAALLGWCFGFGYFTASLYWIGASFLVEAEKFAILMPLAVIVLPSGLALFYAVAFALSACLWTKGPHRILTLSVTIAMAEIARSYLLTGLPWNLVGHSLTSNEWIMQSVSLYGLFGLSGLALIIFASPAALLDATQQNFTKPSRQASLLLVIALASLAGLYSFGAWRLSTAGPTKFVKDLDILLVHPSVPQREKVNPALRAKAFERVLNLTRSAAQINQATSERTARLIIWPETAIPFAINGASVLKDQLGQFLKPGDELITGAFRLVHKPQATHEAQNPFDVYNSLYVINRTGAITASYDKHHLVPFGEYLPWSGLLEAIGLEALVRLRGGFTSGRPPVPITLNEAPPFLPFICYEAIFPITDNQKILDAKWILNISNDGWFGKTAGPYQHHHLVRLRSLETGLPMIRVVNNGISGVFDGLGREVKNAGFGKNGVTLSQLPQPVTMPISSAMAKWVAFLHFVLTFLSLSIMNIFDNRAKIN